MPAALDVDWVAVEKAAIAGMEYPELSVKFGIAEGTIRARASRYDWPVSYKRGNGGATMAVTKAQNQAVSAAIASSAQETHAATATQLVNAAAKALGKFAAKPAPVTDWQAASVAYKVQRLAAGIDKEGTEIKVQVGMFEEQRETGAVQEEPAAWNVDAVTVEPGAL